MNRQTPRRRTVLKALGWTSAGAAGLTATGIGAAAVSWSRFDLDTAGAVTFTRPLPIPPLAEPTPGTAGVVHYDLVAAEGSSELVAGVSTPTWGFNGPHLGPTLRVTRGQAVEITVRNELSEATSVHWHGAHLPARADGGPHSPIAPGSTWQAAWTVDQPAATLWYHPHLHGTTSQHVYRGLAGLLIVDDPDDTASGRLPSDYGVDDIPLILQDVRLDGYELDMDLPWQSPVGRLGDTILTNGASAAYVEVTRRSTRLRILNGSDGRTYSIALDNGTDLHVIATDGGLLERPVDTTDVVLSPGERIEVVIDMEPGERRVLRSNPTDLGTNGWDERFAGGNDRLDLLELRAADTLGESPSLPSELGPVTLPDVEAGSAHREFRLVRYTINDQPMDLQRIDFGVAAGAGEIWRVTNPDGVPHNFHVHDVQFQILQINGSEPPPVWRGRKDTVFLPSRSEVVLAVRFGDHTDPSFPYMFHCHMTTHEDLGMMGQFVVLGDGESVGRIEAHDAGHR